MSTLNIIPYEDKAMISIEYSETCTIRRHLDPVMHFRKLICLVKLVGSIKQLLAFEL